jgi:hypothetical protein
MNMTLDGCLAMAPKSLGISHGHWITSLLEECCGPIDSDACDARGFCLFIGIVGEDNFAFNNTREATLRQEVLGLLAAVRRCLCDRHGFLLRFRQRQGRIRPRKG